MHLRITLLFILTIGIIFCVSAQDPFERLYRSQADGHIATAMDAKGSGFVVLSMQVDNDDQDNEAVNVTSFDQKGKINWSSEYTFLDTVDILAPGDIKALEDGSIAFSILLDKDSLNKVITLVDGNSGGIIWTRITGQKVELGRVETTPSKLVDVHSSLLVHTHRVITDAGNSPIVLSAYDLEGTLAFENYLSLVENANAHVEDLLLDIDTSILILGSTNIDTAPIFLTKMDTNGTILWTRSYDVLLDEAEDMQGLRVTKLTDSTIVIVGALQAGNAVARSLIVIQTDDNGMAIKTERLQSNIPGEIFPVGLVGLGSSIGIAVKNLRSSDVITTLVKYNMDSVLLYESLLDTTTAELIYHGDLVSGDSLTAAFISSSYYPDFDNLAPYLAKVGQGGETPCYTPTMQFSLDSVGLRQDTLMWEISGSEIEDSILVEARPYSFDPPRFTLTDTTYCPNDEINYILDATTRGAESYLWSDGSTDSTLLVTEEGMYMVTVVVGIEECFSLCDTANITRSMLPTLEVASNDLFCESGEIELTALPMASSGVVSLEWSTGSTENTIRVSETGTYSAMIVDRCGDAAQGGLTISEANLSGSTPLVANTSGLICDDRSIILSVGAVPDLTLLTWSSGETGVQSISVTETGSYTATYNAEFCPGEVIFTLTDNDFNVIPEPMVTEQCNAGGTAYNLSVAGTGIVRQEWSDGSTSPLLSVTEAGQYSVTVFGVCDDQVTETVEVSEDDINNCIIITLDTCLRFPNVFIPRDQTIDLNQSFGPKENCPVSDYELNIFNRWGQNIWTTTDINQRWDGTKDGDEVPGGVYFWWAREGSGNEEVIQEGDVTLVR